MDLLSVLSTMGIDTSTIAIFIVVLASLVEISPIKVNPWSFIIKSLGKSFNEELQGQISSLGEQVLRMESRVEDIHKETSTLNTKIDKVDKTNMERYAVTARVRILRFCDEMGGDELHSKDSYDQVMSDITFYEEYCKNNPDFKNMQTELTVDYIKNSYRERLEKGDFREYHKPKRVGRKNNNGTHK